MKTKRSGHLSELGHSTFARPRRDVWGLFFLGLATTVLTVGAGLFLADASLEPKTAPQEQTPTELAPDPTLTPVEEPETTTPSQPEPDPEAVPPGSQPETPPPNNDAQQPQISEPDIPPGPVQPPIEIDNVDLEPTEPKSIIFREFMEPYHEGLPSAETSGWTAPDDIRRVRVNLQTGYAVAPGSESESGVGSSRVDIYPSWY